MTENIDFKNAPIFTPEKLAEYSESLNAMEESAYEALKYFTKGKLAVTAGFAKKAIVEGIKLKTAFDSLESIADAKQFINELAPVLTHSKILPVAKLACNLKDSALSTLATNKLIQTLTKITPDQLKDYDLDAQMVEAAQLFISQVQESIENEPAAQLCDVITSIENDYDANFENLHDSFMGVVNTVLDPMSLFGPSDAIALA